MLGGSNRDYYRVHVSARTALTSTAILILALGANTARERALHPTATRHHHRRRRRHPPPPTGAARRFGSSLSPSLSSPLFYVFFFSFSYLLSGICHDALCLVTMISLSRSLHSPLVLPTFPPWFPCLVATDFYDTRARRPHTVARTRRGVAAARRRRLAIDVGRIRNFDTRRSVSLSLTRARASYLAAVSLPLPLHPQPSFSFLLLSLSTVY